MAVSAATAVVAGGGEVGSISKVGRAATNIGALQESTVSTDPDGSQELRGPQQGERSPQTKQH
eukprot:6064984-Prorocentrum_lima.AAC.1